MKPETVKTIILDVLWFALDEVLHASLGRIHIFRSGGGLRVARLEKAPGVLIGYGEHPNVEEALSDMVEDFAAGGREYGAVYGPDKPHYLTGSSDPSSELDRWILKGSTCDSYLKEDVVVVELDGYEHQAYPEGLQERVLTSGKSEVWEARGFTFESSASKFPNGEPAMSTSVLKTRKGATGGSDFFYQIRKTGCGETFKDALFAALKAEGIEHDT